MHAPMGPSPRRQARQAATPVADVCEAALDVVAVVEQALAEQGNRILGQVD